MFKSIGQVLSILVVLPLSLQGQWTNVDSGQQLDIRQIPNMSVVDNKLLINAVLWDDEDNFFSYELDGGPCEWFLYWDSVAFSNAFTGLIGNGLYNPVCREILHWNNSIFIAGDLGEMIFDNEEIIIGIDLETNEPFNLYAGNSNQGTDAVVYHDTLFVFGQLWHIPGLEIEGNELPQTAAWTPDGEWHFVGGVWVGIPKAEVYDDKIVVVGFIEQVVQTDWTFSSGTSVVYYEDGVWSAFPGNIQGDVGNVFVDQEHNRLYCTGGYMWIDGELTSGMIMYDGNQWHKMFQDDPLTYGHIVTSVAFYRGQVYAFEYVGNGTAADGYRHIIRYDGYEWHHEARFGATSSNMISAVQDMVIYKDELYVAGSSMDSLNGEPLYPKNIAKLYVHPDSVQWGTPESIPDSGTGIGVLQQVNFDLKVFPNPNDAHFHLGVQHPFSGAVLVTDLNGIQLYYENVVGMRRHTIDLGDIAGGTYLVSLVDGGKILATEKVVVSWN
ncbi:MAG: T9SS type A sorting domain-containing protein [Flavobacteriales bacterium]|nr:T9SS type A sorting domain-containing protein [Flavobacteriales bacterium]